MSNPFKNHALVAFLAAEYRADPESLNYRGVDEIDAARLYLDEELAAVADATVRVVAGRRDPESMLVQHEAVLRASAACSAYVMHYRARGGARWWGDTIWEQPSTIHGYAGSALLRVSERLRVRLAEAIALAPWGARRDGSFVTHRSKMVAGREYVARLHAPAKSGVLATVEHGLGSPWLREVFTREEALAGRSEDRERARAAQQVYDGHRRVAGGALAAGLPLPYTEGQKGGMVYAPTGVWVSARGALRAAGLGSEAAWELLDKVNRNYVRLQDAAITDGSEVNIWRVWRGRGVCGLAETVDAASVDATVDRLELALAEERDRDDNADLGEWPTFMVMPRGAHTCGALPGACTQCLDEMPPVSDLPPPDEVVEGVGVYLGKCGKRAPV